MCARCSTSCFLLIVSSYLRDQRWFQVISHPILLIGLQALSNAVNRNPCVVVVIGCIVVDIETVSSLDIAFKNFSLVGGEEAFVGECGGSANLDRGGLLQNEKIVNVSSLFCGDLLYVVVFTDGLM